MSHLKYYSYDGVGKRNKESFSYSQAVRVGDRIEISGQGKAGNMVLLLVRLLRYFTLQEDGTLPPANTAAILMRKLTKLLPMSS